MHWFSLALHNCPKSLMQTKCGQASPSQEADACKAGVSDLVPRGWAGKCSLPCVADILGQAFAYERKSGQGLRLRQGWSCGPGLCDCDTSHFSKGTFLQRRETSAPGS